MAAENGEGEEKPKRGRPPRPDRPAAKAEPANDMPWDDDGFRGNIARKLTQSETLPYRVWARKRENPRYALSEEEQEAIFQSWDMTLQMVGPMLPIGLIAGSMFLIGHLMPVGMRMAFPPKPLSDEEKREWKKSLEKAKQQNRPKKGEE